MGFFCPHSMGRPSGFHFPSVPYRSGLSHLIDSDGHFRKAPSPMEVTDEGISTDFRDLQNWKAPCPMEVTEDGILMDSRDEQ